MKNYMLVIAAALVFVLGGCVATEKTEDATDEAAVPQNETDGTETDQAGAETDEAVAGGKKEAEKENRPALFDMDGSDIVINGLRLGDDRGLAEELHGKPLEEGTDEFNAENGYFEEYDDMYITYFDDRIEFITADVDESAADELKESFPGMKYIDPETGSLSFYMPESEQVLIYRTTNNVEGTPELLLAIADENFHHSVQYYDEIE